MTIREYINTGNKETYIKLGAKDGGAFIYCGKIADAESFLKEYDDLYIARCENNLKIVTRELEILKSGGFKRTAERLIKEFKEYSKAKKKGGAGFRKDKKLEPFKTLTEYKRHLKRYEQELLIKTEKRIDRLIKKIQSYTAILTREVVETYPSTLVNEDGFKDEIVLYKGEELGYSWDLTEFRRGGGDSE